MFEKNLHDLVRGIRTNKTNEAKFIAACIEEIRNEIKTDNMSLKCQGITKLVYLQMMGYDMSWSNFNTIEVMSATKFTYKRTGYLAASQSFHENTDLLMLATNMIRKDLCSISQYESSLALTGLACFVNLELARDLSSDLMTLISSSKPFIRKKAILTMYKVLLKFPDALRPAFPRIKEKLDDPDPGVQCAAVNVICELARKNPKNYISLAPVLFKMLTNSSNNWMLIKVIKLFGALMPEEPRLCKKLVDPLTNIIHSTNAMSLLYESINTLITGVPDHVPSIQLATQKLNIMLDDSDQNLKYLGLLALIKILKCHPKYVSPLKEKIIKCLDDKDESIRRRALDLVVGMVNRKNLPEIVKKLVEQVDLSENMAFKEELLLKIINICNQNNYQFITNFEWYVTVLVELTKLENTNNGRVLANQMLDVTIRVKTLRPFALRQMTILIENIDKFSKSEKNGICEVIYAAGWLVGEFNEYVTDKEKVLNDLFSPKVLLLPPHIQAILVQTALKLYGSILTDHEKIGADEDSKSIGELFVTKIAMFTDSNDLEVQERSCCALQLVKCLVKLQAKGAGVAAEFMELFTEDLNPVAPKAQKKVPVPEGLDLDAWIYTPKPSKYSDSEEVNGTLEFGVSATLPQSSTFSGSMQGFGSESAAYPTTGSQKYQDLSATEIQEAREQRESQNKYNPYYLQGSLPSNKTSTFAKPDLNVSDIPVSSLSLDIPLKIDGHPAKKGKKKKKKGKKGKKGRAEEVEDEDEEEDTGPVVDVLVSEMPDGAMESEDDNVADPTDPHAALNIDLSAPFIESDYIKGPVPYSQSQSPAALVVSVKKTKGRKKKKKKNIECEDAPVKNEEFEKKKTLKDIVAEAEQKTHIAVHQVPDVPEHTTQSISDWLNERKPGEESQPQDSEKPKKKKSKTKEGKPVKTKKKKKNVDENNDGTANASDIILDMLTHEENGVGSHEKFVGEILGEDENLCLRYHPHTPSPSNLSFSVDFSNSSTSGISSIKFDISDSINTKLVRSSPGDLAIPFVLAPGQNNSHTVSLSLQSIYISQKVKGSATYFIDNESGSKDEKMINFSLPLNLVLFIVPTPLDTDGFSNLIASNRLDNSASLSLPLKKSQDEYLGYFRDSCRLTVVEQIGGAVSLYGKTARDDEMCVLVKVNGSVSVDIKGSDQQLINSFIDLITSGKL